MNTEVGVWLWHKDEQAATKAIQWAEQFFLQSEACLSRFLPNSELSRLNRSAGSPFIASPELFNLIQDALSWRKSTGGIFDPSILNALVAQGYNRSFEEINRESSNIFPKSYHQPAQIKLNRAKRKINLPAGVGLDMGGIAKGWAVQQAVNKLSNYGPVLVDAGGDIACYGDIEPKWLVNIANPHKANDDIATVILENEAVATSSLSRRRWKHNGQQAHHLIDPRTGKSTVTDLFSVTVVGKQLPDVEIHAKVTLILGREKGLVYLSKQPNLSALLVKADGDQIIYGEFEKKSDVYSNRFNSTFLKLV